MGTFSRALTLKGVFGVFGVAAFSRANATAPLCALISCVACSLKALLSERSLQSKAEPLSPGNFHSVVTTLSVVLLLPFALLVEGDALARPTGVFS